MTKPNDTIFAAFMRGRQGEPYRGLASPTFLTQSYVAHAVGAHLRANDCDPDAEIVDVDGYAITVDSFSATLVYRMGADGVLTWQEAA